MKILSTLEGHQERCWSVAWNWNGDLLASTSSDRTARIWSQCGETYVCKSVLCDGHQKSVRGVTFSPCGRYLATTGFDGLTVIWNKENDEFEVLTTLEGHENEVKSVAWSSSGQYLTTCGRDKTVWVWEVDEEEEFECSSVLAQHTQDVKSVKWNPHKDEFTSCSYDNTIKFYCYDGDDWITTENLTTHQNTVWDISFDASGERMVSVDADGIIVIWKMYKSANRLGFFSKGSSKNTWKSICTLSGLTDEPFYSVDWCHLTGLIAVAGGDNSIKILNEISSSSSNRVDYLPEFQVVHSEENAHFNADVNCVRWNPKQSGILASCGDDSMVRIWLVDYERFSLN